MPIKIKHHKHYKNFHVFAVPIIEKFGTKHLLDHPKLFTEFWDKYVETYEAGKNWKRFDFKNQNFRKKVTQRLLNMNYQQKKKRLKTVDLHENYIKFHVDTKVKQRTKSKERRAAINEQDNIEIITKKVEKKKITEISFASSITVDTVKRIETETNFLNDFASDYISQLQNQFILHNRCYGEENFSTSNNHLEPTASSLQASPNDTKNNGDHQLTKNSGYSASENSYQTENEEKLNSDERQETLIEGEEQDVSNETNNSYKFNNKGGAPRFSGIESDIKKGVVNSRRFNLEQRNDGGGVGVSNPSRKPKFHFQHLALSNQLRQKLQDIANDLSTKILECNPRELSDMNRRLDTITKLIDTSRKLDLQPVYMLNQIAEGGFNRQKELQGAVVNDKSMIDNGQIVLEKVKEEQQITSEDIEKDLKTIGSSLLLDTASHFADEANTIEQNITDAEFEEESKDETDS